ncbi:5345_t:CDS:2, partial [Gigaspora rosea]
YRKLEVFDASKNNNFLSMGANNIFPLRLIGTTDVAIIDRISIASNIPQNHVWVLFELKKSINDSCIYQALAELTAGDLKSTHKGKAVALIQQNMKSFNGEIDAEEPVPKRKKLDNLLEIS